MKHRLTAVIFLFFCFSSFAQSHQTENIVIFTLDGMRWEEVFGGIDSAIVNDKKFTEDSADIMANYWSADVNERRKKLFPFVWNTIAKEGQVYGNRNLNNYVNVTNPYRFSYPGYNEIFTGYPDTAVNSNDKIENKNINVLEYINKQKNYSGKVAAFSTWDVFPYILNAKRSGIYVNSGVDSLPFSSPQFDIINQLQFLTPKPIGVRPDVLTYMAGKEYLKEYKPNILYIAWDETDDYAHGGEYDQYLKSAHAEDGMIQDMWNTLQSMPQYQNKTTLIVTCDHGRGDEVKEQWRSHGSDIKGADEIWIAVIGPDTKPTGEARSAGQLYQKQLAPTIAALLGLHFKPQGGDVQPVSAITGK